MLLGLVLAQHAGVDNWDQLNQFQQLPRNLDYMFPDVMFIDQLGKKYNREFEKEGVAHTYFMIDRYNHPGIEVGYIDLMNYSFIDCWTCGNIVTSALDSARFSYEYLGTTNILGEKMQKIMKNAYERINMASFPFIYGLGVFLDVYPLAHGQENIKEKTNVLYGHPGIGIGSYSEINGYNSAYDFSLSVNQNTDRGLGKTQTGDKFVNSAGAQNFLNCNIFDLTLQFFSKGTSARLNCT